MPDKGIIESALLRLLNYIESQNYSGYDPYDALKSPLFRLPVLKDSKLIRFGAQQFVKRFPLNLRPLLTVPKGLNPVTLGLLIQGYSYLVQSLTTSAPSAPRPEPSALSHAPSAPRPEPSALGTASCALCPEQHKEYLIKITCLVSELKNLISAGFNGACWGYDFPWEARYATIPAYHPNIVSTGIIGNALFECWHFTGKETAKELYVTSADFVLHDLSRTYEGDSFCFSYSPFDKQQVFNANMKGVRLLAQVYSLTNDSRLKSEAQKSVQYVLNNQNSDGSWFYSRSAKGKWIDNYHTGYILDCLDEYLKHTGDETVKEALEKGYRFYRESFFEPEGRPEFYSDRSWPVDSTAAAQSILTLCRFGDLEMAKKVAEYMIGNMQSPDGGFYFRKYRYHTEKTIFMRWSNAWMFAALSRLLISKF